MQGLGYHFTARTFSRAHLATVQVVDILIVQVESFKKLTIMGDSSSQEVIPQQEVETESVKRSEMCIGLNYVIMTLPKNIVTGITIMLAQPVTNPTLKRTQLVTNATLNMIQGITYIANLYHACICQQHNAKPLDTIVALLYTYVIITIIQYIVTLYNIYHKVELL